MLDILWAKRVTYWFRTSSVCCGYWRFAFDYKLFEMIHSLSFSPFSSPFVWLLLLDNCNCHTVAYLTFAWLFVQITFELNLNFDRCFKRNSIFNKKQSPLHFWKCTVLGNLNEYNTFSDISVPSPYDISILPRRIRLHPRNQGKSLHPRSKLSTFLTLYIYSSLPNHDKAPTEWKSYL